MRRRELFTLLGGAAIAWPVAPRAQQPIPVIGLLGLGNADSLASWLAEFRRALHESGFTDGRNVTMEIRWVGDSLPAMVADLVARRVSVIVAYSDFVAQAVKAATETIPIVYVGGGDPVSLGLVASLNRPGRNVTGVTVLNVEIAAKRLQVLKEALPTATTIAALLDRTAPNFELDSKNLTEAARSLGLQINILQATNPREIDSALEAVVHRQLGPLVVGPSPLFNVQSRQLAALTVRHALPAIFQTREFVVAGGLMSYGGSLLEAARIVGTYTGRILKGERPADLPVQQVSRFELIVNLKSAKALAIEVPPTLLAIADEVVE